MEINNRIAVRSIVGDLRQGGTLVTAAIDGDTDALQFGDNVALSAKSFAGFDDIAPRTIFDGHVLETPDYSFDPFTSQVQVRLGTANYLLRGGHLQDIGFTEQGSPANDHQIAPTMTISDCYSHIMQRHCNFVFDATEAPDGIILERDIETSDTALARLNVHKSDNFWSALVQQLGGGEEGGVQFFRPRYTRRNKEVYQPAPHFMTTAPTSKGTLTKEHLRGRIRVTVRNAKPSERVGQVQIIAAATSNTIFSAKFPALLPGDGKIIVKGSGIWADSQARADTLAQNFYEWLTRPYTLQVAVDPGLILLGDDGQGLDIGDKIAVTYDGPTEDTATGAGVHLDLNAADFFVYGYSVNWDAANKTARGTLTLEADN